ncbi:MAG: hypothetical protein E7628_00810 [Ruminococcaceae bacterium]|nr:hypothetical protein [Oscillospiraceae bacterium]
MARRNKSYENYSSNFLLNLVRGSLILSLLDRLITYIYSLIKDGLFGSIFTAYRHDMGSRIFTRRNKNPKKLSTYLAELRYGICRQIESSFTVNLISRSMKGLMRCRLKVFGAFAVSFGIYSAIISFLLALMNGSTVDIFANVDLIVSVALIVSAIPLILSKKSLGESIVNTFAGRLIMKLTGYTDDDIDASTDHIGRMNIAFGVGLVCGILSYWISLIYILCAIIAVVAMYLILVRPEIGVVVLFIAMPWLPTMVLSAIVGYTAICYLIKLFRGKRVLRFEAIDIVACAFSVLLLFGGVISLSDTSLNPALLMTCLILGYFLTVQLITSREWLIKCAVSCVLSATAVALYGMAMYFLGLGYTSKAWLDSEMFDGISGRAIATLGNPNVLGEYLILIIPIAVAMIFGFGEGLRRLPAVFCTGILGACLILTWSRGAWLALLLAGLIFLFVWNKRSLWLIIAGVASIPILPAILPDTIISRFSSIGNMADSSTSYRVYIWRATVNMIKDNFLSGIGIGEGAWAKVYPMYTYMGIEAAPHSHNLYLQVLLELGVFGLAVFFVFIFLLYQSGFTFFKSLSGSSTLVNPDISANLLSKNLTKSNSVYDTVRQGKYQLRISTLGPMCGILAVIVQGMTDYSWYNYRMFLMFWLVSGLAVAYIRNGRSQIAADNRESCHYDSTVFGADIALTDSSKKKKNRKKASRSKGGADE